MKLRTSEKKIQKILTFKEFVEEQNLTIKQAVDLIGFPYKSIHYYINKLNIKVNVKSRRLVGISDNYFDIIDSEKKAYILGFIAGDGNISLKENRLTFRNSIDDSNILELIKSELSPEATISNLHNQQGVKKRKAQKALRISSKKLVKTLISRFNIVPAKTYHDTFKFPFSEIPDNFIKDFIRGFFDADGNISYSEKNGNIVQFNFSFIFTSKFFAEQIAEIFEKEFNLKRTLRLIVTKNGFKTYVLRFYCPGRKKYLEINNIYNYFYKNSTCFLERKKVKFEGYLNTVLTKKGKKLLVV